LIEFVKQVTEVDTDKIISDWLLAKRIEELQRSEMQRTGFPVSQRLALEKIKNTDKKEIPNQPLIAS